MPTDDQKTPLLSDDPAVPPEGAAPGSSGGADAYDRPFPLHLIAAGFAILAATFGIFALWSRAAPIESAVVAAGVVSVDSYRKSIQHLEGGIVEKILVADGDRVTRGQALIELSDVQPAATLNQLRSQLFEARATLARLIAERDAAEAIAFPADLLDDPDPAARSAVAGQQSVFESRRKLLQDRLSLLEQRVAQSREEIGGLEGQIAASDTQRDLLREELSEVGTLFDKGLVPKPRMLALQRRLAEIEGELSALRARIAQARQSIIAARLEMSELRATTKTSVVDRLRAEQSEIYALEQKIISAEDVLRRTRVVSPIDGIVVDLQVHTLDGVVGPGQRLLDVVPSSDELVVEASVDPSDIDEVRAGMPAHVQLTSLSRRSRLPIEGRVIFVSADRLVDRQSGAAFYQARVQLDPASIEERGAVLQAGMGAEVFIRTGERTALDYLIAPIARILNRGMRES
ncbi:HlyD family type I secretion periplasmic adaptor subunit [Pelagibius sp.]|uniref:HlyD family type I secretion periplasmic adaptor subunit n=1 Tax=Pelagibius sp. TaxID=1931238 RepID=UPI0026342C89|nr:HlyD family type I secretion periplasmic adaptor subunit [Pelagibius sp.]